MRKYNLQKYGIPALILLGVLLVFLFGEKSDQCSVVTEKLNENIESLVVGKVSSSIGKRETLRVLTERCRFGNSSGACYELFRFYRKVADLVLNTTSQECLVNSDGLKSAGQHVVSEGLRLMTQLAWVSASSSDSGSRFGWFGRNDLDVFCKLRRIGRLLDSDLSEPALVQNALGSGAGAVGCISLASSFRKEEHCLSESQIWEMSIFSYNCGN